ncbi:MAG: Nramp family divalent metal transporter [Candidatus Bathyarchaeia archaeon]
MGEEKPSLWKAGDIKPPLEIKPLPEPPPLTLRGIVAWCGPAVILGTLSVGGFEAYHAGYMGAKLFAGIFWLYIVSSFFQLFLNNEIARWTMATGETILQGFTRLRPRYLWGWLTAIFAWLQTGWPAWITGAAAGAAALSGIGTWESWSIVALALVWIIFAASRYVYRALELLMYGAFIIANVGLTIFTLLMTTPKAVADVAAGWVSFGLIPAGITVGAIGPFLLQPAGGFWNFWHTYWVRERGMGMAHYYGHVTGFTAKPEDIRRSGYMFDTSNPEELRKWSRWMKLNAITMVLFFIILGGIWFTFMASLAGYTARSVYAMELPSGWKIAVVISEIFGKVWGPIGFSLFGLVIIAALFDSQFSIYDGIARQFTDSFYVEHPKVSEKKSYRFWYFIALTFLVAYGICAIPLGTPYFIWLIANWLGQAAQAYITILVLAINLKFLPKPIRPRWYHLLINIIWIIVLIGYFILWTIVEPPRLGI